MGPFEIRGPEAFLPIVPPKVTKIAPKETRSAQVRLEAKMEPQKRTSAGKFIARRSCRVGVSWEFRSSENELSGTTKRGGHEFARISQRRPSSPILPGDVLRSV